MPPSNPTRVIVTDANVLINLMHAGRLNLLSALTAFEFVVPDHVVAEITAPAQRHAMEIALTRGALRKESITDPKELATFAEHRRIMGSGEAACLSGPSKNCSILPNQASTAFLPVAASPAER